MLYYPSVSEHNTEMEEQEREHMLMEDCCMKTTIKRFVNLLTNKPLSDTEALLLCMYQFITSFTFYYILMQNHFGVCCLSWLFGTMMPNYIIQMLALFINIMLIIQIIENIKDVVHAIACKCDYMTTHPELNKND